MRKTIIASATLLLSTALLTGCGGSDSDAGKDGGKKGGGAAAAESGGDSDQRKVTIEVLGEGETSIYYNLGSNKSEKVTLPWKKTETLTLTDAEKQVGALVSVVPGSVRGADGKFKAAGCVITVDGKKVADNANGNSDKPCSYQVK